MRDPAGIARAAGHARTVCVCCHVSPDGDTIGRFRNILEKHHLQEVLFEDVKARLKETPSIREENHTSISFMVMRM